MNKINQEEYEILKELDDKWKWVARDKNGEVWVYKSKPSRLEKEWDSGVLTSLNNNALLQFIEWEDKEPYNIDELIEEYEHKEFYDYVGWKYAEREETEVEKDIEWLKREINELPIMFIGFSILKQREEFGINKDDVMELIDQLDEPEVLSQEWIDKNKFEVNGWNEAVHVEDLQNLLVPKQELPVIPKFVAEAIEEDIECGYDVYESIDLIIGTNGGGLPSLSDWVARNIDKYARAYLGGYTVEKEPLYRARLKVITDEFIASYLCTQSSDAEDRLKALEIGSKYINEDYRHLSEFTEDELKKLDIWDSEQWEVEEV